MIYCTYDAATGVIHSCFDTPESCVALNTRPGDAIYYGEADTRLHRVDIATGELITIEETSPAEITRRRNAGVIRKIVILEQRQCRPIRELLLNPDSVDARQRIQEIEAEIQALRADL